LILVIGPPGSGKGTQCSLLAKKLGLLHISTGDMCRDLMQENSDIGQRVAHYINRGAFVPDALMIEILQQRLRQPDAIQRGVLLDGFPRTAHQAFVLAAKQDIDVERFVLLQAYDEVCKERILGRRIDPVTKESYHVKFILPPEDQPEIKQRLVRRELDLDEKIIDVRLKTFYAHLGLILQYFSGKIQAINCNRKVEEIHEVFLKLLSEAPPRPVVEEKKEKEKKPPKPAPVEQCVICMSEPAEFLAIPCGHQCGCEGCLNALQSRGSLCPICRHPFDSILRVFRAGIVDADEEPKEVEDDDVVTLTKGLIHQSLHDDGGWGEEAKLVAHQTAISELEKSIVEGVKIEVAPCEDIDSNGGNANISIHLDIPDLNNRIPVDICCVVDISGSMGEDAKFQDPNDETKTVSEGMNQLDIVKHAVKTIMHTLTDQDRLAIVSFDSVATTAFSLSEMNEGGRQQALVALEKLQQDGNTDIWAGLLAGLEALRVPNNVPQSNLPRKSAIILLTDGQPNRSPPEGEERALRAYFEKFPNFHCQVNTFGFGYNLNSKLLHDISVRGRGTFSFIPDAKIVGTCFVSAVANACSTMSQNCKVHLTCKNGSTFNGAVSGKYHFDETTWGRVVELGPLHYGQSRDLVVPMNIPTLSMATYDLSYLEVVVEYDNSSGDVSHKVSFTATDRKSTRNSVAAWVRNHVVTKVTEIIDLCEKGNGPDGIKEMKVLIGKIAYYDAAAKGSSDQDQRIITINSDVSGRMAKALSTVERFKRWGKHYLRAITRSHQLQIRTNFMDPGLQVYGGSLFKTLDSKGGEIFLTLPIKKKDYYYKTYHSPQVRQQHYVPPVQQHQQYVPSQPYVPPQPVVQAYIPPPDVDNSTYYGGSGGGCFDQNCTVLVVSQVNNNLVPTRLSDLKKSDIVSVVDLQGNSGVARINCVVKLNRVEETKENYLVEFKESGLKITKKHPIRINGEWYLPKDFLEKSSDYDLVPSTAGCVYNFVLDKRNVLLKVNGIECVTYGHGIENVHHSFYSTNNVLDTLSQLPGWDNGFVEVSGSLRYVSLQTVN
jgi:adenylate kinase